MEAAEESPENSEDEDAIEDPEAPEGPETSQAQGQGSQSQASAGQPARSATPSHADAGGSEPYSDQDQFYDGDNADADHEPSASPAPRRPDFRRALQQRR